METKVTTHIVKGLLLALVLIVINVIGHVLNIELQPWFGWISIIIFIIAIIWAVIVYGRQLDNNVTFGNLFAHGFKVTAVAICIVFVYTLLNVYVLFPDTIDTLMQKGMEQARLQGKATEEQLQQGAGMMKKIITISILAGVIIVDAILGVIGALIGAAAAKKNPVNPFEQQPI